MRCLFVRSGFLGDIVLSTSAIAAVKRKHPDAEITYSCWLQCAEIISLTPHIEIVTPGNYMTSDYLPHVVDFRHEALMGRYPKTYWGQLHAMQCAEKGLLDLDEMESYKPQLFIGLGDVCEKTSKKLAIFSAWSQNGLHWRLWEPFEKWTRLVVMLKAMGYKTVQIGGKGEPEIEGIDVNLCGQTRIAQIPGILAVADIAIMIDSFAAHCCHAKKFTHDPETKEVKQIGDSTPTVLLAGPIPPECVVPEDANCKVASYYPDCDGPCNHSFASKELPICTHKNSCMKELSVELVVEKIHEISV